MADAHAVVAAGPAGGPTADRLRASVVEVVKAVRAPLAPRFIRSVVTAATEVPEVAARLPLAGWSVTIRVSGDRELHRLNRDFLGEDEPTDVLSFPSGDAEATGYLGDIVISWPAVLRQAAAFTHTPEVEAALLCVHGLLHLLGWDHAAREAEKEMNRLTVLALEKVKAEVAIGRLDDG